MSRVRTRSYLVRRPLSCEIRRAHPNTVDGQGWSPLHPAVKSGGKDVIWLPLSKGASGKIGSEGVPTLLELALTLDDTSVTLLLHEHGANIHATDELGMTILHKACNAGSLPHVESLLNMGSKIGARDVEGWTPLHHSVLLGQGDVVRLLVSRAQQAELDQQDSKHNTALMLATLLKNQGIMELLLGRGASYDVQDQNGITALHHAAKLGFNAGLRILVAKRGKINLADKRGYTALHHAVNSERADAETVKILCTAGANLGERQENGYSALKLAKELGRDDIASRLVRYKRTAREINPIRNNATHGQRSAR